MSRGALKSQYFRKREIWPVGRLSDRLRCPQAALNDLMLARVGLNREGLPSNLEEDSDFEPVEGLERARVDGVQETRSATTG